MLTSEGRTSQQLEGILFDLDGVLMIGGQPVPGALETLRTLSDAGVPFRILSNITMSPRQAVLERFRQFGINLPPDLLLTPSAAAVRWLRQQGDPSVAVFVTPESRVEFAQLRLVPDDAESGADFVVIGDLLEEWTYHTLNRALRLLFNGARLVALGMGRYWRALDGLRLDTGAFATAIAYASGQEPIVIGKPSPDFFQIALDTLGVPPECVAMVGDDIENDVAAAQQVGLKGILVQTGKFHPDDLQRGITPDWVLPSVEHILPLLGFKQPA